MRLPESFPENVLKTNTGEAGTAHQGPAQKDVPFCHPQCSGRYPCVCLSSPMGVGVGAHSRECADALGRVPDVPNLDVGGGRAEDQAGVPTVLDGQHIARVTAQRHDLLARDQVPHLAGAVCTHGSRQPLAGHGESTSPAWVLGLSAEG